MDQVRVAEGLSPEYTWAVVIAGQPTIQLDDGCTTTETGAAARPTPAPAQRTSAQPTISRLWFFSRSPVAPLEQIAAMQAVLQAEGIASSELKDVAQAGCSYAGAFIKQTSRGLDGFLGDICQIACRSITISAVRQEPVDSMISHVAASTSKFLDWYGLLLNSHTRVRRQTQTRHATRLHCVPEHCIEFQGTPHHYKERRGSVRQTTANLRFRGGRPTFCHCGHHTARSISAGNHTRPAVRPVAA
eukprot:scaffold45727_cov72-Phaeocystis_antarctica.AAC.2